MKVTRYLTHIGLASITVVLAVFLYWNLQSGEVLMIKNGPVPVRPQTQKADQLVFVGVNYCKTQDIAGTVRRTLISSTQRLVLPIQSDAGPVTCQQVDAPELIPKGAVPDKYHFHFEITYKVNPIKTVVESFDSEDFVIE